MESEEYPEWDNVTYTHSKDLDPEDIKKALSRMGAEPQSWVPSYIEIISYQEYLRRIRKEKEYPSGGVITGVTT